MKLAVNYSPEAAGLLEQGKIEFDLFKCPPWPEMIATAVALMPTYVHFDLAVGDGSFERVDWNLIDRILEETSTGQVNFHLLTDPILNLDDPASVKENINQALSEVLQTTKRYGPERVIVENIPLPISGKNHLRPAVTPDVFQRLVAETGCGLLLDVSHARITARTLKIPEQDYLSSLPVKSIREMHITGLGLHNGELHDHLELTLDDWSSLEWVLGQIRTGNWSRPDIVAFEYGGTGESFRWRSEERVLANQVPVIYSLLQMQ